MVKDDPAPRAVGVGTISALAAFACAARLLFVWLPNASPVFFIVFAAGVAFGPRCGGAVGLLAMTVSDVLLSGFTPTAFVNAPAMAVLGLAGGALGRRVNFGQGEDLPTFYAAAVGGFLGVLAVLCFSLLADSLTFLLFLLPSGATWLVYRDYVVAGLLFNALPMVLVGALFALALGPTLRAARVANLLPAAPAPHDVPASMNLDVQQ
jgi:uncharacterized membrane protein